MQPDAFALFRTYAEEHLEPHLRAEELHLLSRLAEIDDDELIRALGDDTDARVALRSVVADVTEETPLGLRRLGDALEAHARGCERGLFPIAERVLEESTLTELHVAIDADQI